VLLSAANNVARFDHNPVTGESLGLLIEEQRSNLLTYSEQFDNAAWTKVAATITANTAIAPDGMLTGDKLVETTGAGSPFTSQSPSLVSGTSYTFTCYAKEDPTSAKRFLMLLLPSAAFGANIRGVFDLGAGTFTNTGATTVSIQNLGNGWWRCSVSAAATSTTAAGLQVRLSNVGNGSISAYTGDGYSGIYIWGAQLEAGAFPTSYIPTVASQVTRSADAASMTGANFSSWYRANEGTLFAAWRTNTLALSNSLGVFSVSDGTTNERIQLRRNAGSSFVSYLAVDGGTIQYNDSGTLSFSGSSNAALAYKVNDFIGVNNGLLGTADTVGTLPVVTQAEIGFGQGSGSLNGHIRKIAYYPLRLTNSQLQALTT
jgi:hypothetical protein